MSAMTGDVRDRILALLSAGPATVARLAAGLGVPGGVVSYELKLLERDGLVRVGTTRLDQGVATPVYVSTAAAAPPPLPVPLPLPGLTWIGDEPYPTPLWTVPHPPGTPADSAAGIRRGTAAHPEPGVVSRSADPPQASSARKPQLEPGSVAGAYTGISFPTRPGRTEDATPTLHEHPGDAGTEPPGPGRTPLPQPRRSERPDRRHPGFERSESRDSGFKGSEFGRREPGDPGSERPGSGSPRGPRLHEVRRVPMDDATFYEFAERLDALAREFATRSTPGAPATELTILLTRPTGDATSGSGS
jgi:hypothetical protein